MQIKSLLCCRYTTTSSVVATFSPMNSHHFENSFTFTRDFQSGRSESNRLLRVPKTRGRPVSFTPKNSSRIESPQLRA